MCRSAINNVFYFSRPAVIPIDLDIDLKNHFFCSIGGVYMKHFIKLLGNEWVELVRFIFESHSGDREYNGIKGTEIVDARGYHTVKVTKTCLVYKRKDQSVNKKLNFLVCAFFPNLAIRLKIVARNRVKSVNPDNEYADQVVRNLNEQMNACWRVTSQLFKSTERLYVREFGKVTCSLLLTGYQERDTYSHKIVKEKEFGQLQTCNFDLSYLNKIRNLFPQLNLNELTMAQGYNEQCLCRKKKTHH